MGEVSFSGEMGLRMMDNLWTIRCREMACINGSMGENIKASGSRTICMGKGSWIMRTVGCIGVTSSKG